MYTKLTLVYWMYLKVFITLSFFIKNIISDQKKTWKSQEVTSDNSKIISLSSFSVKSFFSFKDKSAKLITKFMQLVSFNTTTLKNIRKQAVSSCFRVQWHEMGFWRFLNLCLTVPRYNFSHKQKDQQECQLIDSDTRTPLYLLIAKTLNSQQWTVHALPKREKPKLHHKERSIPLAYYDRLVHAIGYHAMVLW